VNLGSIGLNSGGNTIDNNTHSAEKVLSDPVIFYNNVYFTTFTPNPSDPCNGGGVARVYGINMQNATAGLYTVTGESSTSGKVAYHVYAGNPEGGIPSSPTLSIYPSGQSSIFVGFSTGAIKEIKIDSPPHMKTIKSWKEIF
jgi:Tfp pilus tip-associated adhesin PilY1